MDDVWSKVLAWISLIIGIVILALGALSLAGVITPWIVRVFGGLAAVVLGAFLAYWGVEKLRGVKNPIAPVKRSLQDASAAGARAFKKTTTVIEEEKEE